MPYYAMLIQQKWKDRWIANGVLLMVQSEGWLDPCTINGQFKPISRNVMV